MASATRDHENRLRAGALVDHFADALAVGVACDIGVAIRFGVAVGVRVEREGVAPPNAKIIFIAIIVEWAVGIPNAFVVGHDDAARARNEAGQKSSS